MMAHRDAPITEQELRRALLAHLEAMHRATPRTAQIVLEELGIEGGLSRIDVAVVGEGLTAFELKSDFDAADRLTTQIHAFNRVFGCIHLVVSARTATDYAAIVPRWWGVWVAVRTSDPGCGISFVEQRRAANNPLRDALSIASLLRVDEALAIAAHYVGRAISGSGSPRVNKTELCKQLAERLTVDELTHAVATTLKERWLRSTALQ